MYESGAGQMTADVIPLHSTQNFNWFSNNFLFTNIWYRVPVEMTAISFFIHVYTDSLKSDFNVFLHTAPCYQEQLAKLMNSLYTTHPQLRALYHP